MDPMSPPEHLIRRGLNVLKKIGPETSVEQVERVTPEMAVVLERAREINPRDPAHALQRALDKLNAPEPASKPALSSVSAIGKHDWPPIITLSEADGYYFETGSAELSPQFRATLSGIIVERLLQIVRQYDVNVVEVVGHTSEQPLSGRTSNLDKALLLFLQGRSSERLIPSDNAGLGLARAVAVLRVLREDKRLSNLHILPLSGAQLTDIGDRLSTGVPYAVEQRRRIEIRVRRSDREPIAELPDSLGPAENGASGRAETAPVRFTSLMGQISRLGCRQRDRCADEDLEPA